MPYIAHLNQASEGCDYTIGCGCKVIALKSLTSDGAVAEMHQEILENYTDERALSGCVIYDVVGQADIDLASIYAEIKRRSKLSDAQAALEKATRDVERAKKQLASMG